MSKYSTQNSFVEIPYNSVLETFFFSFLSSSFLVLFALVCSLFIGKITHLCCCSSVRFCCAVCFVLPWETSRRNERTPHVVITFSWLVQSSSYFMSRTRRRRRRMKFLSIALCYQMFFYLLSEIEMKFCNTCLSQ